MAVEARRMPLEILADAAARLAATGDLRTALDTIAEAARAATDADLAVIRIVEPTGELVARAVAPAGSAAAAEVAGTRIPASEIAAGEPPAPTRRAAERLRAAGIHSAPALAGGRLVGSVELVRIGAPFDDDDREVAELAATQLALAAATFGDEASSGSARPGRTAWLELAGDALAAGADGRRAAQHALRIAVEASGAAAGAIWSLAGWEPDLIASHGDLERAHARGRRHVLTAVEARRPAAIEQDDALPAELRCVSTLPLGEPAFAALQLFYPEEAAPEDAEMLALGAFAARAAFALQSGRRSAELEAELDRTRSLLDVVGQAMSHLSLAHTLETAVESVAELLQIDQLGVYLLDGGRLSPAAGRGLEFGHEEIASRLLELTLGPMRARATLLVQASGIEPALRPVREALEAAGQRAALAVPLHAYDDPIGLLVAYPGNREFADSDGTLLGALAAQLAVAVHNARLHEQSKELSETLAGVLASERQSTRQLSGLYEISRSFAQSLSLETTLGAVTSTIVDVLGVDAAVIRVPDERGEQLVPRAVHVVESRLAGAVRTILERPQPRPPRTFEPTLLDAATARRLGGAHALLVAFLEKGSTAALLPIATPTELLAQLTILSLDPASPIDDETLATARTISQQAALAIDNARLYHQQKQFAETMQQSLLPRKRPAIGGLEIGAVYESAAQVEVGGDVFDFLELPDDRLAVVLGDVTGHGIDATADMAMAKFVFRSLARDHTDPAEFLAHANDVVVDEIASGKFITMAAVVVDPRGDVVCASAGHPEPRVVLPDGTVEPLCCGGLALGIEPHQVYEVARAELPPGGAVVLYTDGVPEARRGRELYGVERLDELLSQGHALRAQALAESVLVACRNFAGGDLADDCAVVVIRRST